MVWARWGFPICVGVVFCLFKYFCEVVVPLDYVFLKVASCYKRCGSVGQVTALRPALRLGVRDQSPSGAFFFECVFILFFYRVRCSVGLL